MKINQKLKNLPSSPKRICESGTKIYGPSFTGGPPSAVVWAIIFPITGFNLVYVEVTESDSYHL